MAETTIPYRFDETSTHATIALFPELNQAPWGEIDGIGAALLKQMKAYMEKHPRSPAFIVDLSPLNYMGSAMVALVVRLWKAAKEKNGRIVVVNDDENVLEVLRLSGLEQVWTIVESREVALNELGVNGRASGAAKGSGAPGELRENEGMKWAFAGIALMLVSAAGLFLFAQDPPIVDDLRVSLGILYAAGLLGLICATVAAAAGAGLPRTLGVVAVLGCLALFACGVVLHPQRDKLWERPQFDKAVLPEVDPDPKLNPDPKTDP